MSSRAPPPRPGPAKLTIVLAVIVPLAVGVGAGLLFFKKPKPAEAQDTPALTTTQPPPSRASADPNAVRESSDAIAASASKSTRPDLQRAEAGDAAAVKVLNDKPALERSVDETLALARGRIAAKQRDVEDFRTRLRTNPDLLQSSAELAKFRGFVDDRDTAVPALSLLGETPTALGADVLYDVWVGTRGRNDTTWLAEQLVFSPEVRRAASKALQVTLSLRTTEACEPVKALLPEARDHGDTRSLRWLKRLLGKRGCGKQGREDCFACLRTLDREQDAVSVAEAITLARKRRPPKTR